MKVFSHCELDHFDGCVGCKADGKGDCAAVFVDVPPRAKPKWRLDTCWRSWLIGGLGGPGYLAFHLGPFSLVRVSA